MTKVKYSRISLFGMAHPPISPAVSANGLDIDLNKIITFCSLCLHQSYQKFTVASFALQFPLCMHEGLILL